ncbi:hypothetical protein KA012_02660 [Candidatus Woesebacteria bacterium]|nr:hypothetical protein [Candidatus Woesebacteria bacterium]
MYVKDLIISLLKQLKNKREISEKLLRQYSEANFIARVVTDINQCVEVFSDLNRFVDASVLNMDDVSNSQHLKSLREQLPPYQEVIQKLQSDANLREAVLNELLTSSYFSDVYTIKSDDDFVVNMMILFYRTTLLFSYPELRENRAQISSSLEECSVLIKEMGSENLVFDASQIWFDNFENEGFTRRLYDVIQENRSGAHR